MKKNISALFILASGACILSADVYVGGFVGGRTGTVSSTTTTTTTAAAPAKAPEFSIDSYDGGEFPLSLSEASWILVKANIMTGAALGDRQGLSEQAFAMASLLYKTDTIDAKAAFKDIFDISTQIEGKLYGLMGLRLLGEEESYRNLAKLIDPEAKVNCLVSGKFYVIPVSTFLTAFEKNPYNFVPRSFPEAPIAATTQAGTARTASTTTTTTSVIYDYYPSYYWGPSYVVINVRPRPHRPHPPKPRPPSQEMHQPPHRPNNGRPAPTQKPAPKERPAMPQPRVNEQDPQAPREQGRPKQQTPQAPSEEPRQQPQPTQQAPQVSRQQHQPPQQQHRPPQQQHQAPQSGHIGPGGRR